MRLRQHYELLLYLTKCKNLSRRFVSALPSDVLKAIWEVALNVKLGNVSLSTQERQLLDKRKRAIKKLASKATRIEEKLNILTPTLLKALLRPALRQISHGNSNEIDS
jgi:hypothetical protein